MLSNQRGFFPYRQDIDGIRAIAVLLVVGYHAFPDWVKGGFIGVDVFFVISGFLISKIIFNDVDNQSFSIWHFYVRRIKRIFPALIIILLFCLCVGWVVMLPQEYKQLGKQVAAGAGFISNFVLWAESGYFESSTSVMPLVHLWSLGIEEQFYLFWPLIVWGIAAYKANRTLSLLLLGVISFAANIYLTKVNLTFAFYMPMTRCWELIAGALLANSAATIHFTHTKSSSVKSTIELLIPLLLIGCGVIFLSKASEFPGWPALIPVLATLFLLKGDSDGWINKKLLSNKLMVWFSQISYPLYLWHWPLLAFARVIEGDTPSRLSRILIVGLSIFLAWVTSKFVENPIRFGRKSWPKVPVLLVTMMLVGGCGLTIYFLDGVRDRFPRSVALYVNAIDFEWSKHVRTGMCNIQDQSLNQHSLACREAQRPLIAIWGDSHAASLYPGFKKLQTQMGVGLEQLTTAGCPPLFDLMTLRYKKDCNQINQNVFKTVEQDKPEILILHAAWRHADYLLSNEEIKQKLTDTIHEIKLKLPTTQIVIIGPAPRWKESPQKVSYRFLRTQIGKSESVPEMQVAEQLRDIDVMLSTIAIQMNVDYVSITNELCSADKCLSRVGQTPQDFTAIDEGHLSKVGSEYLVNKIMTRLNAHHRLSAK